MNRFVAGLDFVGLKTEPLEVVEVRDSSSKFETNIHKYIDSTKSIMLNSNMKEFL